MLNYIKLVFGRNWISVYVTIKYVNVIINMDVVLIRLT